MRSHVTVKVMQFDQQLRPALADGLLGAKKNIVLGSFHVHFENVRLNVSARAERIKRDRWDENVLTASFMNHGAVAGIRGFAWDRKRQLSSAREEGIAQGVNIGQLIELNVFSQQRKIFRKRLERKDAACRTYALSKEQRVIADVRTDIDNRHTGFHG